LPPPSSTQNGFVVNFQATSRPNSGARRIRQTKVQGFITPDGNSTENCTQSTIYDVNSAGVLSLDDGEVYSTSTGISSILFAPASDVGNITTTWQFSGDTLRWNNEAFLNGTAALCLDQGSNAIYAYFLSVPPASCTPVELRTAPSRSNPC